MAQGVSAPTRRLFAGAAVFLTRAMAASTSMTVHAGHDDHLLGRGSSRATRLRCRPR
jgi:hypothetical protein